MRHSNSSNPNPPYGDKAQFRKLTVTVPPDVYERLIQESARRKIAGESNQLLSALLREALSEYLDRIDSGNQQENRGTPHAA
jgi:transcriptional regulator of met regulon